VGAEEVGGGVAHGLRDRRLHVPGVGGLSPPIEDVRSGDLQGAVGEARYSLGQDAPRRGGADGLPEPREGVVHDAPLLYALGVGGKRHPPVLGPGVIPDARAEDEADRLARPPPRPCRSRPPREAPRRPGANAGGSLMASASSRWNSSLEEALVSLAADVIIAVRTSF
jgi:hypothetical protein